MSLIFLIFIALSPFSPIIFRRLDLWYAAGHYFQFGILILLSYSFFEKTKSVRVKNLPLALLTLYLGVHTAWWWHEGLTKGIHNILILMPFFNFLCFLLFYKLAFFLNRKVIGNIVRWFTYSISIYLLYCVLQYFDFDQLMKVFAYVDGLAVHRTVGFIGNESQNGLYLALCLPFFYIFWNRFTKLASILLWVVIAATGSASGLLVAFLSTMFFTFFYRLGWWYYALLLLGAGGFLYTKDLNSYLSDSKRVEWWKKLWPLVKETGIWGRGMGTMNILAKREDFFGYRHAHNSYLQQWFTTGVLGVVFVLNCIHHYFQTFLKDRLSVGLATVFFGFCIGALIYFPTHLFLMSTVGMIAYSFQFVLKNEVTDDVNILGNS